MKRMSRLKALKLNDLNLPPHTLSIPVLTVTGTKQLLIESTYRLLQYKENDIKLLCGDQTIQIKGDNLIISFMYPDELMLIGTIKQIIYYQQ